MTSEKNRPVFASWISRSWVERTEPAGIVVHEDDPILYPFLALKFDDSEFADDIVARWEEDAGADGDDEDEEEKDELEEDDAPANGDSAAVASAAVSPV